MKRPTYNFLDLFSGAGGLSLGLIETGRFRVIGAVDNWEPAIDTFRYNHPDVDPRYIFCGDIHEFLDEKNKNSPLKELKSDFPEIDLIVGGPPCQGMSLAGKRLNEDPRNELFRTFVQSLKLFKPKAFLMENVPGLLSMKNGNLNKAILNAFTDAGYDRFSEHIPTILKAERYGVPQIRRRLFYIGFRDDFDIHTLEWPPAPTHKGYDRNNTNIQIDDLFTAHEQPLFPEPITVSESISDLPKLGSGEGCDEVKYPSPTGKLTAFQKEMRDWKSCPDPTRRKALFNHEASRHTDKLIQMIKEAKPGESVDPKYSDSKKWHPDRPGFTVKALGAGGGSTNRRAFHYDPKCVRGSTIRENARIQSFPDWFRFLGPKTHQMTQVGNAVPPKLAFQIGISISNSFDKAGGAK